MRTSSKTSSEVTEARSETLCFCSGAEYPLSSLCTTNPRIFPSSSFAQTTAISAIVPFVIHILAPLRIQCLPSLWALVVIERGSDPASGSVSPKHPINFPEASFGRYSIFCSSEPNFQIGYMTRLPCTEAKLLTPESPLSSSWQIRPYIVYEHSGPPYFAGTKGPKTPSSASFGMSAMGKVAASQCSAMVGSTSLSMNLRTVSLIMISSSLKSSSILKKSSG